MYQNNSRLPFRLGGGTLLVVVVAASIAVVAPDTIVQATARDSYHAKLCKQPGALFSLPEHTSNWRSGRRQSSHLGQRSVGQSSVRTQAFINPTARARIFAGIELEIAAFVVTERRVVANSIWLIIR